jgi:hypothetical protein
LQPTPSATPPEETPLRKIRQLWILAAVAYSSVIVVTLLAAWTYLHFATVRESAEASTMIAIGSVWLPVYPGAVTERSDSTEHDRAVESTFCFRSKDPTSKVLAFYAPKLRTARFQSYSTRRTDAGGMLQAIAAGRDTTLLITARPWNGGSEVQITTIDR